MIKKAACFLYSFLLIVMLVGGCADQSTKKTDAVLHEHEQGEGGDNVQSENYHKEVRAWCDHCL